jgi:hypothetical protein
MLVGVLLAGATRAAEDAPRFILHTAAGKNHVGSLKQIGDRWSVLLLEGEDHARVGGDDLVSIRREKTALPAPPSGEFLLLANGDVLPLTPEKTLMLVGEQLRVQANVGSGAEMKIPLSAIRVIGIAAPEGTEHPDRLRRTLAAAKRSRDAVYLRNGDVIEGVLTNLDRMRVEMEVDKKDVSVEFGKVAAIALNTDLVRSTPPKEAHARVVLSNGGRLTLVDVRCDGKTLSGKTAFGGDVRIPLADLVALSLHGGAAVYLSDLKPAKYVFRPYLGSLVWNYVADGSSIDGRDIRLAGSTYDKGLGMHAESQLTYDLGGKYRRFEARVGLDDRAADRAAARVRVLVDGKTQDLGTAAELLRRGTSHPIAVDVKNAKQLTLVVDFVPKAGVVPGDVDWGDARLIRAEK